MATEAKILNRLDRIEELLERVANKDTIGIHEAAEKLGKRNVKISSLRDHLRRRGVKKIAANLYDRKSFEDKCL